MQALYIYGGGFVTHLCGSFVLFCESLQESENLERFVDMYMNCVEMSLTMGIVFVSIYLLEVTCYSLLYLLLCIYERSYATIQRFGARGGLLFCYFSCLLSV